MHHFFKFFTFSINCSALIDAISSLCSLRNAKHICFHFISGELISCFLLILRAICLVVIYWLKWIFCFSISLAFIPSYLAVLQTLQNFQTRTRSFICHPRLLFLRGIGDVESPVTKPIDNMVHVLTSRICLLASVFLI